MPAKYKNFFAYLMTLTFTITLIGYKIINETGYVQTTSLDTAIDKAIPFVSYFIVPYVLWFFFINAALIYLCKIDKQTYAKTLLSLNFSIIVCLIIYSVFQTTVQRPILTNGDIFTKMVQLVYNADKPVNCFPSIHCLTSYLMFKGICKAKNKSYKSVLIIAFISFCIILSTLFVKQHVIMDVFAAILLGEFVFGLIYQIDFRKCRLWIKKQSSSLMTKKKSETL